MIVYNDALDDSFARGLLNDCHDKFFSAQHIWSSNYNWQQNIVKASHPVLTRPFEDEVASRIIDMLIDRGITDHREWSVMNFVWTKLSYIPWHNDDKYSESITIYLNESWDEDWGGIFLYKESRIAKEVKGLFPVFNTAVKNARNLTHCITPVSLDAGAPRFTIQMFSQKERDVPPETKKIWAYNKIKY